MRKESCPASIRRQVPTSPNLATAPHSICGTDLSYYVASQIVHVFSSSAGLVSAAVLDHALTPTSSLRSAHKASIAPIVLPTKESTNTFNYHGHVAYSSRRTCPSPALKV